VVGDLLVWVGGGWLVDGEDFKAVESRRCRKFLELKFEGQSKVDVEDRWMNEEGFYVG